MDGGIAAIIAGASIAALALGGQMIAPEWLAAPFLATGTLGLGAAIIVAYSTRRRCSATSRTGASSARSKNQSLIGGHVQ